MKNDLSLVVRQPQKRFKYIRFMALRQLKSVFKYKAAKMRYKRAQAALGVVDSRSSQSFFHVC